MARYIHDQNKVVLVHESGTYAATSGNGVWPGQVTSHSIDDAENKIEGRYFGTGDRSYDTMDLGPRDVTGTITYNPQNFMTVFMAIGSVYDASSGANVLHTATEVNTDARQSAFTSGPLNPLRSFTIEDSKTAVGTGTNFIRTINGIVPNATSIIATQGEKVRVEQTYVGQTLTFSSGNTTSVTTDTTTPYLWSSTTLTMGGNSIVTAKDITLEINNNVTGPHYLNGSRDVSVPFPGNRDNTLSVTLDLASETAKALYETYYKDNTEFNATLDFNQTSTGSQHAAFTLSGCRITSMENPSELDGPTETTVEVMIENVSAQEWTSSVAGLNFNPW